MDSNPYGDLSGRFRVCLLRTKLEIPRGRYLKLRGAHIHERYFSAKCSRAVSVAAATLNQAVLQSK